MCLKSIVHHNKRKGPWRPKSSVVFPSYLRCSCARVLRDEMFGQALKVELGSITERTFLCCVVWISYHS